MQLKELDYTGRLAFSGFSEPFMHSQINEIIKNKKLFQKLEVK